jgi:hypothetical protein
MRTNEDSEYPSRSRSAEPWAGKGRRDQDILRLLAVSTPEQVSIQILPKYLLKLTLAGRAVNWHRV